MAEIPNDLIQAMRAALAELPASLQSETEAAFDPRAAMGLDDLLAAAYQVVELAQCAALRRGG
ncbi:MAG: hypothetical protein QM682_09750 [Paracoccus sp. (in: a-proteobacteria)]|uniref:hypothetical protein n=1 Tax=Paracoccus sp. TaxID=267 RepID=UPI0039E3D272